MRRLRIPAWVFLAAACTEADEPLVEPDPNLAGAVAPAATTQSPPRPDDNPIDAAISDRAREAILQDASLSVDERTIRVETENGVVTLRGSVRTQTNKDRAKVVVGALGSVVRVDNRLIVLPEPPDAGQAQETTVDRAISERVLLAFQNDSKVAPESGSIAVSTRQGVVTLEGTVSSALVRDRAGIQARAVGSVVRIDNRLAVSP